MAGKSLEILLDRVELRETGIRKGNGRHLVMGTLVWPRPRIAERTAVQTVLLENNAVDLKQAAWADRIVWKEDVEGSFAVKFAVTERIADSRLADFLRAFGSTVLKLTGDEAEDMLAGALAGGMVKAPFLFLSKAIADPGKTGPKVIASGCLDLHSETIWTPLPTAAPAAAAAKPKASAKMDAARRQFTLPLTAPEPIYRVTRTRHEGRLTASRHKVLDAGAENGVIVFTAKSI
jgi:hypothetical protein